jgi:hypothetical protein
MGRSVAWRNVLGASYRSSACRSGRSRAPTRPGRRRTPWRPPTPASSSGCARADADPGSSLTTIGATMAVITLFDAAWRWSPSAVPPRSERCRRRPPPPSTPLPAACRGGRGGRQLDRPSPRPDDSPDGCERSAAARPGRRHHAFAGPLRVGGRRAAGRGLVCPRRRGVPAAPGVLGARHARTALVVVVVGSLSTAVPMAPGGAGAQQAMMLVASARPPRPRRCCRSRSGCRRA